MRIKPLERVRKLCLALPEATEKESWGTPTFRVRNKIFVMFTDNHHDDGRVALWCNSTLDVQQKWIKSDPAIFFKPAYVGPRGWLGICLDQGLDWDVVAEFIKEAYRATVPKRLLALLDEV
jgi:predicted DNA-binding protein (MmcQ/YjbR family)